jgi:hypothetical protein
MAIERTQRLRLMVMYYLEKLMRKRKADSLHFDWDSDQLQDGLSTAAEKGWEVSI